MRYPVPMKELSESVRVAVVQAAPALFDRDASVAKAAGLMRVAAGQGAELVLFPEAFIPCYPRGLSFGTVVGRRTAEGRRQWERYWNASVDVPGPTTEILGEAAREAGVYLAIGVIERESRFRGGTLYCTLLYFGPNGALLEKHRKLKPDSRRAAYLGRGRRQHVSGH